MTSRNELNGEQGKASPASSSQSSSPSSAVGSKALQQLIDHPLPYTEWLATQPHCDASLSYWDNIKCRAFSHIALKHWRVKVLADALTAMQQPITMYCLKCDRNARHIAGYSPTYNSVWICANRFSSPWRFRQAVVHEMVHAFDFSRAEIDPYNVQHVACTEIRAYNLSGQCGLMATWNENPDSYIDGPLQDAIIRDELRRTSSPKSRLESPSAERDKSRSAAGSDGHHLHHGREEPTMTEITISNLSANSSNASGSASFLASHQAQRRHTSVQCEVSTPLPVVQQQPSSVESQSEKDASKYPSLFKSFNGYVKRVAEQLNNQASQMKKKVGSLDEMDEWKLQDTKRNRCLSHRTLQSLRDHEIAKLNQSVAYESIVNVLERCIRDTWPFMGPPERDSWWRPSRLYSSGTNTRR